MMRHALHASRNGFYAWLHQALSDRAIENQRLLGLIRDSYTGSSGVYVYPRAFADFRGTSEACGRYRVARKGGCPGERFFMAWWFSACHGWVPQASPAPSS